LLVIKKYITIMVK